MCAREEYNKTIFIKFLDIIVDLVKHGVLTLVGEIQRCWVVQ